MSVWIWLVAGITYLAFRLWYDSWRGPLRPDEIEAYMAQIEASGLADPNERETLRAFLEADDGREFVMLNLVRLRSEPAPHPRTGEPTPAPKLLREYLGMFLPALVGRAGHPLLQARKVGGYVDAWNVEPDPAWSSMGYMRYRSRRDMMELIVAPSFLAGHPFKVAALRNTFSFPTQPAMSLYAGPRIWVGLVLALIAALASLAVSGLA